MSTNETIGTCGSKLSQAKKFDELTQEQQIQAMRQEIRNLCQRMGDMVNVASMAKLHSHNSLGQAVMPVIYMDSRPSNYIPLS